VTTTRSLQRAHRETAAIHLAAGLTAFLIATGLSWNADVLISVTAGALAGIAAMIVLAGFGLVMPVSTTGTIRSAILSVLAGAGGLFLVSIALGGDDSWVLLAVMMLTFGVGHLHTGATAASRA
jgi:hypothetical protein